MLERIEVKDIWNVCFALLSSNSVKSRVRGNSASRTHSVEGSVLLDGKDSHRTVSGVQAVEKLSIAADGNVQICGSAGIVSNHRAG